MTIGVEYINKGTQVFAKDLAHGHYEFIAQCVDKTAAELVAHALNTLKTLDQIASDTTGILTYCGPKMSDPRV